jgi:hypothetical protein
MAGRMFEKRQFQESNAAKSNFWLTDTSPAASVR